MVNLLVGVMVGLMGLLENNDTEPLWANTPVPVVKETNLGEYKLTAYCSCAKCCGVYADNRPTDSDGQEIVYGSTGERLTAGYSIAVDPSVIPYGSVVTINGHEYKAMDCGGAIKGNRIDIYFNDHKEALKFGVQYADVYLIKSLENAN